MPDLLERAVAHQELQEGQLRKSGLAGMTLRGGLPGLGFHQTTGFEAQAQAIPVKGEAQLTGMPR
jgi:hypothetical protein